MSYVATIARETGWSREYILWRLPYAAGLGVIHAASMHHGLDVVFCERRERPGGGMSVREQLAVVRRRMKTGEEGLVN